MPPERPRRPLRPGWYPAGDGRHQRFYAGRERGWTDHYLLEIGARDPSLPTPSQPLAERVFVLVAAVGVVGSLMVILIAVVLLLAN